MPFSRLAAIIAATLLTFPPASAMAEVYVSDDFESYETIADVLAAGWVPSENAGFELRTGQGQGALGSNKWLANTNTTQVSSLVYNFDKPMPSNVTNNVHIYTRANAWYRVISGVALRSDGNRDVLAIGTRRDPSIDRWTLDIDGNGSHPGRHTLNSSPNRAIGVWTKLELHQVPLGVFVEINDQSYQSAITYQRTDAPYTSVRIGHSISGGVVEYDNIHVWTGDDTSVIDWDLYQ